MIQLKEDELSSLICESLTKRIKDLNIRAVYKDIEYCDNIAHKYLQIPVKKFEDELDKHEMKKLYRKFKIMKISRRLKDGLLGAITLGGLLVTSNNIKKDEIENDSITKDDMIAGGTIGGIAGFFTGAFLGMITDRSFVMKEVINDRDVFVRVNKDDNIYEVILIYRKNGRKIMLRSFKLKSRHFF